MLCIACRRGNSVTNLTSYWRCDVDRLLQQAGTGVTMADLQAERDLSKAQLMHAAKERQAKAIFKRVHMQRRQAYRLPVMSCKAVCMHCIMCLHECMGQSATECMRAVLMCCVFVGCVNSPLNHDRSNGHDHSAGQRASSLYFELEMKQHSCTHGKSCIVLLTGALLLHAGVRRWPHTLQQRHRSCMQAQKSWSAQMPSACVWQWMDGCA